MKYIDIHSHLHFPQYDADRAEVIARMNEQEVGTIVIGTSIQTSRQAITLAESHPNIYASIGIHPVDAKEEGGQEGSDVKNDFKTHYEEFKTMASHPKVVCVGECGLDYGKHPEHGGAMEQTAEELQRQRDDFNAQIEFAVSVNKPMMIHARNSHEDILDMLEAAKKIHGEKLRGNAHFFTGNIEIAKRYLALDFSLSFTGVITFAKQYAEVVNFTPLNMIMAETDAPYVSPVPHRGQRNEPAWVIEMYKKIAELKGLSEEEVRVAINKNAEERFGIKV